MLSSHDLNQMEIKISICIKLFDEDESFAAIIPRRIINIYATLKNGGESCTFRFEFGSKKCAKCKRGSFRTEIEFSRDERKCCYKEV